jgi:hypothetical protein
MQAEGLNPDLISTPDAPAPPGGRSENDENNSDADD